MPLVLMWLYALAAVAIMVVIVYIPEIFMKLKARRRRKRLIKQINSIVPEHVIKSLHDLFSKDDEHNG